MTSIRDYTLCDTVTHASVSAVTPMIIPLFFCIKHALFAFTATVMPFGRLSVESEDVRRQTVNWMSYVQ